MKILVVEHSATLKRQIQRNLRRVGYVVDTEENGEEGLWRAKSCEYDVIILDSDLPRLDGLGVLQRLRQEGNEVHVLMLGSGGSTEARLRCLRAGADDFLSRPFSHVELLVRVGCLIRREYHRKSPVIRIQDLEIDTNTRTVRQGGRVVALTPREFRVLEYLALNQGIVLSRAKIEEHIYQEEKSIFSNAVESSISTLRKKLHRAGSRPLIHTRRGMGYMLSGEEEITQIGVGQGSDRLAS